MDKCPFCESPRVKGVMKISEGDLIGFSCGLCMVNGKIYYGERPQLCKDREFANLKVRLAAAEEGIKQLARALSFAKSTIMSGEKWSNEASNVIGKAQIDAEIFLKTPTTPDMVLMSLSLLKKIVSLTLSASDWGMNQDIPALHNEAMVVNEAIFADESLAAALEEK